MTTPSTNLGLSSIQTEFGGANPISLSEYYRGAGGGYVPVGQATSGVDGTAVSTSGTIRMGMFRSLTKVTSFTYTATIAANANDYNLRSSAIAAGWNGTSALIATITINSGVIVGATATTNWAWDTGSIPAGSTISLINNGTIEGKGGNGGAGSTVPNATLNSFGAATAGGAGGPALRTQFSISITNNGTIAGGGGGGGGGGASKTDTSGKGTATYGAPGSGGGGGAGQNVGTGGAGSTAAGCNTNLAAGTGASGALTTAGAGGSRAVAAGITGAGIGGTGGARGTAGSAGGNPDTSNAAYYTLGYTTGAAGGAAGNCTNTTAGAITWVATGTRLGTIA